MELSYFHGGVPINSELSYVSNSSFIVGCIGPEHPFVGFRRRIAPFETV